MRIAYIRVSSIDQNEQRQIEAMQKYNIEKWFTEKISAKDTNRQNYKNFWSLSEQGTRYIYMIFHALRDQQKICLTSWNYSITRA